MLCWLLIFFGVGVLGVIPPSNVEKKLEDFQPPKVTTNLGVVKGAWMKSYEGKNYASFTAIPYAKPPVGTLRFEPPVNVEPWIGEWDASKKPPTCMAIYPKLGVMGLEDCLYLNVYTPKLPNNYSNSTNLLPVLLDIHGGAFMFGSSATSGAKYLMDRDVILVTINYRVGPLGFLSLEDEIQPGNNGMRDQVAALKWVQQNIQHFGGDPDSVTLMGVSAGGASVHYHYLSPMSKGLFHRGISVSGSALCRWALADKSREKALSLAASVGCPTEHGSKILIDCLKTRPAERILEQVVQFQVWQDQPFSPFAPVVEKSGSSPFLPETPARTLSQGTMQPLPWITGVTSAEGIFPAALFVGNDSELEVLNSDFTSLAPHLLDFNLTVTPGTQKEIATEIRKFYFGEKPIDNTTIPQIIKMFSDRLFVVDAQRAAEIQSKFSPVYFYQFDYRGKRSFSEFLTNTTRNYGVSHGDDSQYYLETTLIPSNGPRTGDDLDMQNLMLNLWTNYAKTGVPSPNWSPVIPGVEFDYLHITGVPSMMKQNADLGNSRFWDSLPIHEEEQIII